MARVFTIKEAIGELDAIRMDASRVPSISGGGATLSDQNRELSHLVSELASVTGWFARHLEYLESELFSNIPFETDDDVATLDSSPIASLIVKTLAISKPP